MMTLKNIWLLSMVLLLLLSNCKNQPVIVTNTNKRLLPDGMDTVSKTEKEVR